MRCSSSQRLLRGKKVPNSRAITTHRVLTSDEIIRNKQEKEEKSEGGYSKGGKKKGERGEEVPAKFAMQKEKIVLKS